MKRIGLVGVLLIFIYFSVLLQIPATPTGASQIILSSDDIVQDAITLASNNTVILLKPGTYNQTLTISKPITIAAEDPTNPPYFLTQTQPNKPIISINVPQVTISHIHLTNTASGLYSTGIRILASNTTIYKCSFSDTPIGIAVWSSYTTISNCTFTNCSDEGIVLLSTTNTRSDHNIIANCIFQENCDAIELQQSSYNTITHCTMDQNTHCAIDAIKTQNNHNIITNCRITNTSAIGLYFSNSSYNLISNCSFQHNAKDITFTEGSIKNRYVETTSTLFTRIQARITSFLESIQHTQVLAHIQTLIQKINLALTQ